MAEGKSNGLGVRKPRSFKDIVNQRVINSQSAEITKLNKEIESLYNRIEELKTEAENTNSNWRESERKLLGEAELWKELFEDMRQKRDNLRQELAEAQMSDLFPLWRK